MAVTIGSNISSLKAQRQLDSSATALSSTYEKLSSGQRINRASDDAAGLAVSSTLNSRARVYSQASRNINDAISLVSVTDGALSQLSEVVIRQRELAEQAASGTYSGTQRKALEREANALVKEYNRVIDSTSFNGLKVFSVDTANLYAQHGYGTAQATSISIGEKLGPAAGNGSFATPTFLNGSVYAQTLIADLNGDGNNDILQHGQSLINAYLGNGDGTFQPNAGAASVASPLTPVLADFNGDGILDVATPNQVAPEVVVNIGNGNGTFQSAVTYSTGGFQLNDLKTADINGDGIPDLVAGSTNPSDSARLFLGRGNGTFGAATTIAHGGFLGDVNSDGAVDIVQSYAGYILTSLGRGDGTFGGPITTINGSATSNNGGALVDFNQDGKLDFVATMVAGAESLQVRLGNGNGTFGSNLANNFAVGIQYDGAKVADFNGDGKLDFVTHNTGASSSEGFEIYLNDGAGNFTFNSRQSKVSASGSQNFDVGDFTSDGISDLVFGLNVGGGGANVIGLLTGNSDSSGRRNPYQYDFNFSSIQSARSALRPQRAT